MKRNHGSEKMTVHDEIRDWLVNLGQQNGYEAWTTDKKNRVQVSICRDSKVDYRPDVVWKPPKTREKILFELIFTEDFRKVIGEMFLASQVENFTKMFFIRPTEDEPFWKNIERFLRYTFERSEGVVRTYHRPSFIIFPRSLETNRQVDEIKARITEVLRKDGWLLANKQS